MNLTSDLNVQTGSDNALMVRVQEGKLNYMEILFTRYKKPLFNYFLKCTLDADDSNDLTQITFIRIMKYRNSFKPDREFKIWLFQIARNLVKDHFRKMKIHHDHFNLVSELPDMAEEALSAEQEEREVRLHQALSKLPDDKRELIVLSKFQGLKYEEIARIRNVSVSAVKVQVHRTIGKLRELFFENGNE